MLDLSIKLKSGDPEHITNSNILKAKFSLYEISSN